MAVVVIIGAAAFVGYRMITRPAEAELMEDQQTVPVRRGDLIDTITVTGSVSFPDRESVTFGSPGVVAEVLVTEGQRVKAGDLLATLDLEAIAGLDRGVAEARVALRDARDELADLVDPPPTAVVDAHRNVVDARTALHDAETALDDLLNPDALRVAEMEAAIVAARLELDDARQALEDALEPPSAFALEKARNDVEDALDALEDLEEPPTALEIATAKDNIARAEKSIEDAEEELSDYLAGAPEEDLATARIDVDAAEKELEAAVDTLSLTRRDWEASAQDAQDAIDEAAEAYSDEFVEWLGIEPDATALDSDYGAMLASYGVDLVEMFDTPQRFAELGWTLTTSIPADDPATAWNETRVYLWLNFAVFDLQATCEENDVPTDKRCIEEEFRSAANVYQDALDARDDSTANFAKTLSSAETAADRAEDARRAAEQALADLQEPPDALVVETLRTAITLAEETRDDANRQLDELISPPNIARQIELAKATVEEARENLAELQEPPNAANIANLEERIELASAKITAAELDLEELLGMEGTPEHAAAIALIESARQTLADRQEDLADLLGEPDAVDLDLLVTRVSAAESDLSQAETRLADARLTAPWDGFVSSVKVEAGQEVEATTVLLELVDTSVVEIDGSVDEIDVLQLATGSEAEITMDALQGETAPGTVSLIGAEPVGEQGIVSYPVKIRIDAPEGVQLPEGLTAVASITISEYLDVILVPLQAVRGSFDRPTVTTLVDGEVVETAVSLGESDDFWTIVESGVGEGDTIVMEGAPDAIIEFGFEDGQEERPRRGRGNRN